MRNKIILAIIALLAAFAFGRFSAPETIKTVEVEKKTADTVIDKDKHKDTIVIEVIKPDGTKTITTQIKEDTKTNIDKHIEMDKSKTTEETRSSSKVTIQALAGANVTHLTSDPLVYGGSISKPILGPVTLGAFGLSNGVAGFSMGLTF